MGSPGLIAKVQSRAGTTWRGSFAQLEAYAERFEAAVATRHSDNLHDRLPLWAQMDQVAARAHPRTGNRAYHYTLSWAESTIPHATAWAAVDDSLGRLKLAQHQWIAAIHADTTHMHVHVVVNRVHPETFVTWQPKWDYYALRETRRAFLDTHVPDRSDVAPRARDYETWTGQQSLQRWARSTILPKFDERDMPRTWAELHDMLATDGLAYRVHDNRGRRRGSIVDATTEEEKGVPAGSIELHLRLDHLEGRLGPFAPGSHERLRTRGYSSLVRAWQLPIADVRLPNVGPLYERWIDARKEWQERGRALADIERRRIKETFAAKLAALTAEFARAIRTIGLTAAAREVLRMLARLECAEIREARRIELLEITRRAPAPLFRTWLKALVDAGDERGRVALHAIKKRAHVQTHDTLDSLGFARDLDDQRGRSSARTGTVTAPTAEPIPKAVGSISAGTTFPTEQEPAGDRFAHEYRRYLDEALAAFREQHRLHAGRLERIDARYRDDETRADLLARRHPSLDGSDLVTMARVAQIERLRDLGFAERSYALELAVLAQLRGGEPAKSYLAWLASHDDHEARALAADTMVDDAGLRSEGAPRAGLAKAADLTVTTVDGAAVAALAGERVFADRGATIDVFDDRYDDGARLALLHAAEKFGGRITLDGDETYRRRMLALAVDLGIEVTNPELAIDQHTLREERLRALETQRFEAAAARDSVEHDIDAERGRADATEDEIELTVAARASIELGRDVAPASTPPETHASIALTLEFPWQAYVVTTTVGAAMLSPIRRELAQQLIGERMAGDIEVHDSGLDRGHERNLGHTR